jgi:hypothetical protein
MERAKTVARTFGKMTVAVIGAIFFPVLIWVGLAVALAGKPHYEGATAGKTAQPVAA